MIADEDTAPRRRPGGRAARVREAVHQAVLDVVIECGVDKVGIPEVSRRSGVRDSSIYRRWGTRENLVLDALLAASEATLPVPDTGTLLGDLTAFALELVDYLNAPLGRGLLQAMSLVAESDAVNEARRSFWETRYNRTKVMVSRAIDRGEVPPGTDARMAMELLIAPIHFRNLLRFEEVDAAFAENLAAHVVRALQPGSAGLR